MHYSEELAYYPQIYTLLPVSNHNCVSHNSHVNMRSRGELYVADECVNTFSNVKMTYEILGMLSKTSSDSIHFVDVKYELY